MSIVVVQSRMERCTLPSLYIISFAMLILSQSSLVEPIPTVDPTSAADVAETQCMCIFDTPPLVVCTEFDAEFVDSFTKTQQDLKQDVTDLTSQISVYAHEWTQADLRITEFDQRLSDLYISCLRPKSTGSEDTGVLGGVRKQLLTIEDALSTVKHSQPDRDVLLGIENKMENISSVMETITTDMADLMDADWKNKAAILKEDLTECREKPSDILQQLTVSQWPRKGDQQTNKRLSLVLQPYTVRGTSSPTPKVWFSDPLDDPSAIWAGIFSRNVCSRPNPYDCRYGSYVTARTTLLRFNSTNQFETSASNYITYYLPDQITDNGAPIVAHDGYLFYLRYNSRVLVKFDLRRNETAATKDLPPDIGISTTYAYTSGGHSSVDLEVDESGLWMIYSTTGNQGLIVLSKVNTTTLEIEQTWYGNFPKTKLGNCFVTSGTLYCVSSHNSHSARVHYYLDTNRKDEGFMNVPFDCKYGSLKSLKYNPYDQKLYAIDNGLAVVYDLIFG